uniref:Uncharacterized protein n=1 Tax=Panagrolaimus sp. JU765 TaxID=591449 RepID=A0AC34PZR2_9BILA
MSLTEQIPTAVAMQLVGSKKFGNYCVIYDLKDGQEWKRFDLPRPIFTDED